MSSVSGGRIVLQNLNSRKAGIPQDSQDQIPGLEHGLQDGGDLVDPSNGDLLEIMDGDSIGPPKEVVKIPSIPKVDQQGSTKWSSLFGVKPSSKSSFPSVKTLPKIEKGSCAITILDKIVDHSI